MSGSSPSIPSGPAAPLSGNLVNAISFARFAALTVGAVGAVGAMVLFLSTDVNGIGETKNPYVGHGIVALAFTFALVTLLLFLAGWAENWLDQAARHRTERPDG